MPKGDCVYRDINVRPDNTYEYYVAAVDPDTGEESSQRLLRRGLSFRSPIPPPVPEWRRSRCAGRRRVPPLGVRTLTSDEEFVAWRVYYM